MSKLLRDPMFRLGLVFVGLFAGLMSLGYMAAEPATIVYAHTHCDAVAPSTTESDCPTTTAPKSTTTIIPVATYCPPGYIPPAGTAHPCKVVTTVLPPPVQSVPPSSTTQPVPTTTPPVEETTTTVETTSTSLVRTAPPRAKAPPMHLPPTR